MKFGTEMPLIDDFSNIMQKVGSMSNGKIFGGKSISLAGIILQTLGLPFKNLTKLFTMGNNLFADFTGDSISFEISRMLSMQSKAEQFNTAVKEGNTRKWNITMAMTIEFEVKLQIPKKHQTR